MSGSWRRILGGRGGAGSGEFDPEVLGRPWGDRAPILPFVCDWLAKGEGGDPPELPDEPASDPEEIRWSAGAMDGVLSYGFGVSEPSARFFKRVGGSLLAAVANPSSESMGELHQVLMEHQALTYSEGLANILEKSRADPVRVRIIARWVLEQCPDREAVKAAALILGFVGDERDREPLFALARHDEFTLFAGLAIIRQADDPLADLWTIARAVTGWGRVQMLSRLGDVVEPAFGDWLVREGHRNDIDLGYTALPCAIGGDLASRLRRGVDDELLVGAAEILGVLLIGPPSPGMAAYPEGLAALRGLCEGAKAIGSTRSEVLVTLAAAIDFIADESQDWTEDALADWSEQDRAELGRDLRAEIAAERWKPALLRRLQEASGNDFNLAASAADKIGIDAWEHRAERLRRGEDQWYWVMETKDPARIDWALSHARDVLRLDQLSSGPTTELGLGEEFQEYMKLESIVQRLADFPGKGWDLLAAALRCPTIRCRNMATMALAEWGTAAWPPEVLAALDRAIRDEPAEDVQEVMQRVRDGGPYMPPETEE